MKQKPLSEYTDQELIGLYIAKLRRRPNRVSPEIAKELNTRKLRDEALRQWHKFVEKRSKKP